MKKCANCLQLKEPSAFYKRGGNRTDLQAQCIQCQRDRMKREHFKFADYTAKYRATHEVEDNPAAVRERTSRSRARYPERTKARQAINNAVLRGVIAPQPCFVCGREAEAHHSSYAPGMALSVTWLCKWHHHQLHREFRRAVETRGLRL
jgi:hypothetical protein